ncbi:hypothetical protein BJ973_005152 [Actinoplanes tereljensis]|uniref:Uncharacterized protein n=1 Tax=Paractinoplanes tereljensis TaxID=571912 RepID=A0A919NNZ1_9ACTN|nr:hypothetical protein [Actinoplanes tereljensis]GIF21401.1 hypothetical protein Ate02nite_41310 [Actinoplanes tereljensis]
MLLDIDVAIFEVDDNGLALDILRMVAEHRHDWRPKPPEAIKAERFVGRVTTVIGVPALAEWAREAVKESAYPTKGAAAPISVSVSNLTEMANDLAHPAVLVVENKRADGGFLQRLAAVLDGSRIGDAITRGWLRIQHGGGNSQMAWLVFEECKLFRRHARVAALLDSDGGAGSESNKQADEIRADGRARVHVWNWRSVENYVPFPVWEFHLSTDQHRLRELSAVRAMAPEQRGKLKIRDRLGKIHPLIPHQVSVTEDDFDELGPGAVDELRRVLNMIREIL